MFRVANASLNILIKMEANGMMTFLEQTNNQFTRKDYPLKFEIKFIYFFSFSMDNCSSDRRR